MPYTKKKYIKSILLLALINLLTFLLYFIFGHVEGVADTEVGVITSYYVIPFIIKGVNVLIPMLSAFILLTFSYEKSAGTCFTLGIPFALTRFIYYFPYYYLYFVYDGYSSVEACGLSGVGSFLGCVIMYAISAAVFAVVRAVLIRRWSSETIGLSLAERSVFDFSKPYSVLSFGASIICGAYFIVIEIIDTVTFLIDANFNISLEELGFIIMCFIIDFSYLFIFHLTIVAVKNHMVEQDSIEGDA